MNPIICRPFLNIALILSALVGGTYLAESAILTINSSSAYVEVLGSGVTADTENSLSGGTAIAALPDTSTPVARAEVDLTITNLENTGSFVFYLETEQDSGQEYSKLIYNGNFTVGTQDLAYNFGGSYATYEGSGRLNLSSYLDPSAAGPDLFSIVQIGTDSPFIIGDSGGNTINQTIGSLSGVLLAGQEYAFNITAFVDQEGASGIGAAGNFYLNLVAIPEPTSGFMLLFAASAGIGLIRRRSVVRA